MSRDNLYSLLSVPVEIVRLMCSDPDVWVAVKSTCTYYYENLDIYVLHHSGRMVYYPIPPDGEVDWRAPMIRHSQLQELLLKLTKYRCAISLVSADSWTTSTDLNGNKSLTKVGESVVIKSFNTRNITIVWSNGINSATTYIKFYSDKPYYIDGNRIVRQPIRRYYPRRDFEYEYSTEGNEFNEFGYLISAVARVRHIVELAIYEDDDDSS